MRMDYIKTDISGNELLLRFVKDELVFTTTSFIHEFIEKTIQSSRAQLVILDCATITHIDSSAAGMFISLKNEMQKMGKRLLIRGLNDNVLRILHFLDVIAFLELDAA